MHSPPGPSEEVCPEQESEEDSRGAHSPLEAPGQHRANTTVHVCWYRNTSVSRADHSAAVEVQGGAVLAAGGGAGVLALVLWAVSSGGRKDRAPPQLSCQVGPDTRGACELEGPREPLLVGTHPGVTDVSP